MLIDMKETGKRLKQLREREKEKESGWTQPGLAKKLNTYTSNELDDENGKVTVSQLERGVRNLTLDMALAYSEVFGVSLDYICGRSEDWQPEYREVKEITGMSDRAIGNLIAKKGREAKYISELISHEKFNSFIERLAANVELRVRYENEFGEIPEQERKIADMKRTHEASNVLMKAGLAGHASPIYEGIEVGRYTISKTMEEMIDGVIERGIPIRKAELERRGKELSEMREQLQPLGTVKQ